MKKSNKCERAKNVSYLLNIKKSFVIIIMVCASLCLISCRKLIEVNAPYTSTNAKNVYDSDPTAIAVLTGIYAHLSNGSMIDGGFKSVSLFSGLGSDELTLWSGSSNANLDAYFKNNLLPTSLNIWSDVYQVIYVSNVALEGVQSSNNLSPAVQKQLIGEAKFIRGLCYFYLLNLYGDVPLALTSDYKMNSTLSRTPKNQVYAQIIADLKDSENNLNDNYVDADAKTITVDRIRPNKWAAKAMLARVYLYLGNAGDNTAWANAELYSSQVINHNVLYDLPNVQLKDVFLKNSVETIWALQPISPNAFNTPEANFYILPATGPQDDRPVYLSDSLLTNFETNDQRKVVWTKTVNVGGMNYSYADKYKSINFNGSFDEYSIVLRLAEQYLIRAEARVKQNNTSEAANDLNVIRHRAGLNNIMATSTDGLLKAILRERQVELFTEWGHRWLDLKRTGNIDSYMRTAIAIKGGTWKPYQELYPIPQNEIRDNPTLKGQQNTGY